MSAPSRLFKFRPMQPADLDLVYGWLNQPHVAPWCGDWRERSRFELDFMERMESDWLFPNIAMLASRPVGYVQYYVAALRAEELALPDGQGILGIDFCLGDPTLLGKGFGRACLRQMADLLFRESAITAIICELDPANAAAIAACAGIGFRADPGQKVSARSRLILRLPRPAA